jgi:lipoprotein-releasing system ATP-binding protein
MGNMLEVKSVSKSFGNETILADISFTLPRGKALALTGQSGSGKTTLLSIVGLLQQATAGKVIVDGTDVADLDQQSQARLRGRLYGFVFQRARLINSLTALENVLVPAWLSRADQGMEKRARELLAHFDLSHRLHLRPQELSLGQLRRVALARALLLKPAIILADEPTNDLDPDLAASVAESLLAARDTGAGVIIVTHDPALAERADERLELEQGRLAIA